MKDDQIDRLVILALILTSLGDFLALLAELEAQKNKQEDEKTASTSLKGELDALRKEIIILQSMK